MELNRQLNSPIRELSSSVMFPEAAFPVGAAPASALSPMFSPANLQVPTTPIIDTAPAPSPANLANPVTGGEVVVSEKHYELTSQTVGSVFVPPQSGSDLAVATPDTLLPSHPHDSKEKEVYVSPTTLKGAWSVPLRLSPAAQGDNLANSVLWPSLKTSRGSTQRRKSTIESRPVTDFPNAANQRRAENFTSSDHAPLTDEPRPVLDKEEALRFPWAARMDPSARNLYRATTPEYMEDGTPKVSIPSHVLRQGIENQKEYVLGHFYRCSPPPAGLIHEVVNKIWGRNCKIVVRSLGNSKYLFHIPDSSTRMWVLQRGLWHIDECLLFVAPWSPSSTLALPDISTVPVWLTLKNIPYMCYSILGISHIASGLGAPMATHKPRLDPTLMGEANILVEVELSKAFPLRIAVYDKQGSISMVDVEYAWIPTKCGSCGQLGHKASRCLHKLPSPQGHVNEVVSPTVDTQVVANLSIATDLVSMENTHESVPRCGYQVVIVEAPQMEVVTISNTDPTTTVEDNISTVALMETQVVSPIIQRDRESGLAVQSEAPQESMTLVIDSPVLNVLANNRFTTLGLSEVEEDSHDSDVESDMLELLTPSGQRFLRDRPVKPTAKAREMQASTSAGGRRGRGRGNRGGRG